MAERARVRRHTAFLVALLINAAAHAVGTRATR
jgi:hypothetical protein